MVVGDVKALVKVAPRRDRRTVFDKSMVVFGCFVIRGVSQRQ